MDMYNSAEDNNNLSSFNFGLNLEAELRLAQHKEQYQDFEIQAKNTELFDESLLDESMLYFDDDVDEDSDLVIQIPELAEELHELKIEEANKKKELLENNNSITLKYNNFLTDKMKYLNNTVSSMGSIIEYQNNTMDTIMEQLNELKGVLNGISKDREQHKIEKETKKKTKVFQNKKEKVEEIKRNNGVFPIKTKILKKRDSFITLVNDENDNQVTDTKTVKEIQPENLFSGDEDIGFLRICKVMDIMIHDAYTAVTTIPL